MKRRPAARTLLRRALQLAVLAFVVYAALGAPWRNYKLAHNHPRIVGLIEGEVWGGLYAANERALSLWGEPFEASLDFLGMPWSARIFGIEFVDPILVTSYMLNRGELPGAGLLAALLVPLGLALVLGKVFCSHFCPMRLLFELGQAVRAGLERLGVRLPAWRSDERLGGWVLLGGLLGAAIAGASVWLLLLPYVALSASVFLWIAGGAATALIAVCAFWLLVDVAIAPGWFCHNLCPTGFALEQLGRFSLFRVRKRKDEPCPPSCDLCHRACPYGLEPRRECHEPACDRCGECVTACPASRLVRGLVSLTGATAVALLLLPAPAEAHHNKGMPHYGYYENYAQTPTEEAVIIQGRWELGATIFNFQGLDRRRADTPNDVKIHLYLYDLENDRAWLGPVDAEIVLGDERIAHFSRTRVDEEATYTTRETLPESGSYALVVNVDGERVSLPFEIEMSDPGPNPWVLAAIGLPVAGVFGLALLGRRRRGGRRRRVARPRPAPSW